MHQLCFMRGGGAVLSVVEWRMLACQGDEAALMRIHAQAVQ
jgi:hypothetical protein